MIEFKSWQQDRNKKQFVFALVFVLILGLGWIFPLLGFFLPLCMIAGIGIGFSKGRKWCDVWCPRGSFYDAAVRQVSSARVIPVLLRSFPFRMVILGLLMLIMASNIISVWPDPEKIGRVFMTLVTITTTVGILLGVFFHQRSWCYICPVGTLANLAGKEKNVLKIGSQLCVECQSCAKVCPMQLDPSRHKKAGTEIVRESDCIKCDMCVKVCPKQALTREGVS